MVAARFTRPLVVLLHEMRAPVPLNAPPVLVQEVAARLTKPVSDTGQAVVCVDTLAGETTVPMLQELTFVVTLLATLPPAKLFVVVANWVRPLVATAEVMVGEPTGAMIVRKAPLLVQPEIGALVPVQLAVLITVNPPVSAMAFAMARLRAWREVDTLDVTVADRRAVPPMDIPVMLLGVPLPAVPAMSTRFEVALVVVVRVACCCSVRCVNCSVLACNWSICCCSCSV